MKLIFKRRDDLQNGVYKVGWLNPTLTLRTLTRRWKTILFCARPHPFYRGNWTGIHLEFPIHFKDIGHMASFTKKCDDHETSSFCVAFGSFGFFLTSTFLPVKHHQPCTVAKCFAASTQHWVPLAGLLNSPKTKIINGIMLVGFPFPFVQVSL